MDSGPVTLADFAAQCADIATTSLQHSPNPALMRALDLLASRFPEPPAWNKYKVTGGLHHLRYDQCAQDAMPANFVVLGDAMMRVNPIFGQGCGKAAIDAATLDGVLRAGPSQSSNQEKLLDATFAMTMVKRQTPRLRSMFDTTRLIGEHF
jgi:2-polyprenyl-6-methoxyphenol hydroxylase-like FAD-dependent oxidoreductase